MKLTPLNNKCFRFNNSNPLNSVGSQVYRKKPYEMQVAPTTTTTFHYTGSCLRNNQQSHFHGQGQFVVLFYQRLVITYSVMLLCDDVWWCERIKILFGNGNVTHTTHHPHLTHCKTLIIHCWYRGSYEKNRNFSNSINIIVYGLWH